MAKRTPKVTQSKLKPVKFIVVRSGNDEATFAVVTVNLTEDACKNDLDLDGMFLEALQKVITNWVRTTDEGKKWYRSTNEDANIGDLCSDGIPDEVKAGLAAEGIFNLDIECISSDTACQTWTYDTHLVDESQLEG
jgi:hypothetical protein